MIALDRPVGAEFQGLLDLMQARCRWFSLVLRRPGFGRYKTAKDMEERLEPYRLNDTEVDRFPGTPCLEGRVSRYGIYRVEEGAITLLLSLEGIFW
jgi:hypothetical protein